MLHNNLVMQDNNFDQILIKKNYGLSEDSNCLFCLSGMKRALEEKWNWRDKMDAL